MNALQPFRLLKAFTLASEDKSRNKVTTNVRTVVKPPLTHALLAINVAVGNCSAPDLLAGSPGGQALLWGGCWGLRGMLCLSHHPLLSPLPFQCQPLSLTSAPIKSSRRASPCRGRSQASQPTAPSTRSSTTRRYGSGDGTSTHEALFLSTSWLSGGK